MRNAFAAEITELAQSDSRVVLLSGDIGNRLFDTFKEIAPDRFFNCGVSEANMISMAAGMAARGLRPIAYTITPFITYRALEQIRVDLCYHNVPAVVVGVGSGMGYASLGATHHSCEDIAMLRVLPHMKVVCPGDPHEVRAALRATLSETGPVYLRLGKKGEPNIHPSLPRLEIGKAIPLSVGRDVCILATGTILAEAHEVAHALRDLGIAAELVSMHTVKPLDQQFLRELAQRHTRIVTLEEHSRIGGMGSAVLEFYHDHGLLDRLQIERIGTPDEFFHYAGEREDAFQLWGLSVAAIVERITKMISHRSL
jgi:transketolase